MSHQLEELKNIWKATGQEIQRTTKALTVDCNTESDKIWVHLREISDKTTQGHATKRKLLEKNAMCYDPLGLFSTISANAKIFFHETSCRSIQCEEILPHEIEAPRPAWINSLLLADIDIPRWIGTSNGNDTQVSFL